MEPKISELLRLLANPKIEVILKFLLQSEDGEFTSTTVAKKCDIFTSYFTKLVNKLVEFDIIEKKPINQNIYLVVNRNKAHAAIVIIHKARVFEDV